MLTNEIAIYTLITIITLLILWVIRLEIKIKNIPSLKNNQNLNNQIRIIQNEVKNLDNFKNQTTKQVKNINDELSKTIQEIKTIRFNPFKKDGVGGNQSFATALIDKKGNGVILSSLYSRERVSVFAKPVKNWFCEYEMSEEEKRVLQKVKEEKKLK